MTCTSSRALATASSLADAVRSLWILDPGLLTAQRGGSSKSASALSDQIIYMTDWSSARSRAYSRSGKPQLSPAACINLLRSRIRILARVDFIAPSLPQYRAGWSRRNAGHQASAPETRGSAEGLGVEPVIRHWQPTIQARRHVIASICKG